MDKIKQFQLSNINMFKLINSVKTQEDIAIMKDTNNETDVFNLPFMVGSRIADNLNKIKNNDMGKYSPIVKVVGYPLYVARNRKDTYTYDTSREASGWSRYGSTYDDVNRCDARIRKNNRSFYIQNGFENKLQNPISNFDRVGVYFSSWDSSRRYNLEILKHNDQYFLHTENSLSGRMKAKYIKDGVISESLDLSTFYSEDNTILDGTVTNQSGVGNIWQGSPNFEWWGYDYTVNNIFDIVNGLCTSYNNVKLFNIDISIESNVWLFNSESALNNYLNTGDYTTALNYNATPRPKEDKTNEKKYYIHNDIWESDTPTDSEKTYTNKNYIEIYIDKTINRPFSLILDNNTQRLHLNTNDVLDEDIIKMRESNDGGETWHDVTLDTFHNDTWRYTEIKKNGRKYQGAEIYTNIPIFKNNLQSELYFNNKINEENSLNPTDSIGDTIINKLIDIGKGLKIKNDLNIQSVETSMSEIVFSNEAFFNELASLFNDDSIVTQIKQGLLMHSNPQDIFIDMFALPFDVAPLVSNSLSHSKMDFGTYEHTFTNTYKIISKPKEITMFSTKINAIFNDWRDYQLNISLYLPYCNIISLPVDEIMNKTLSCTFIFDITSCTIKYFIKSNNITILTCEGVVRYELPLSASNNIQGFKQKLGGASQIINSSIDYRNTQLSSSLGVIDSALSGDWGNVANQYLVQKQAKLNLALGIGKGNIEIMRPTPKNYTGNYSSSCAFYDELNAYLIIEQANLIYNDSIKNNFNLPDNRVSTLSSCHGYTEIDYIDLQSSCTQSEREAILNLLSNGFYI